MSIKIRFLEWLPVIRILVAFEICFAVLVVVVAWCLGPAPLGDVLTTAPLILFINVGILAVFVCGGILMEIIWDRVRSGRKNQNGTHRREE